MLQLIDMFEQKGEAGKRGKRRGGGKEKGGEKERKRWRKEKEEEGRNWWEI